MFLFDEWNQWYIIFYVFISLLKIFASKYYLGICANIHVDWYEMQSVKICLIVFEALFLIEMILQFFRKVTPDGKNKQMETLS